MTAQIRPNRMEVNDRFPMLGFAIRSDTPGADAEVALASDIALFKPENRAQRTAANFYSSREHGSLAMPRGEGIFTVPSDVLARFIGNDRVFFGLATGKSGNGGLAVDALPREGSPYVSLRGFTGRTLRRSYGSGRATTPPVLDWTGDSARPGAEPVGGTMSPAVNGAPAIATPTNGTAPIPYDDGFGPIPATPERVINAAPMEAVIEASDTDLDFPQASVGMLRAPSLDAIATNPQGTEAASSAMVFDQADFDKVDRWANRYRDLFEWSPPDAIVRGISARGFAVQPLFRAIGDTNLDFYKVAISQFPTGWNSVSFLEHFIQNINSFIDTDKTEFSPYDQSDTARLASDDKVGTVFKLDIEGPDNAAVVISARQTLTEGQCYAVTTINTPWSGDHPVSGHRQFGFYEQDGVVAFYTRGADRSTLPIPGTEWLIWRGAHALWQSFQRKVAAFINSNGGRATIVRPFSERFNSSAIELRFGNFDAPRASGMGFADDSANADASKTVVMPALPGDARGRATRIGGEFAIRVGEALDLGLAEAALTPLFDKLDPPAAAVPMVPSGAMSAYAIAHDSEGTATEEDAARTGPGTVNLAPPPEPVARGMDAGAVATIAGVALQQVMSNSGDVSWTTDQFRGLKHPNDTAPANPGPFVDATPISLNWPVLSDSYIDDISAFFRIDWQHNGKSIGNVRITNIGTNDAIGWSLAVRGTIMDDNRLHPPHDCAGLRITLHYHFTHVIGSDQIAMCDIEIFGDGTHTKNCRWIQSSLFAAEQARSMAAA